MSFRARMLLFFVIIVVIPMIAVGVVLSRLTATSEVGLADSELAGALQVAIAMYDESRGDALDALQEVEGDRRLRLAFENGRRDELRRRAEALAGPGTGAVSVLLYDRQGKRIATAGDPSAVAYATATPSEQGGGRLGQIAVSTTSAAAYARELARLTDLEARVLRRGKVIGDTLGGEDDPLAEETTITVGGESFRGRYTEVRDSVGPPVEVGLFQPAEAIASSIAGDRALMTAILVGFFLLAVASLVFMVRSLGGQVDRFLGAARAVGRGEFDARLPVEGGDEFAVLGREFNTMSSQLKANVDQLERERREREETIRRIGEAFAAGLDRRGMAGLAARTAVEACSADAGRVVATDDDRMTPVAVGSDDPRVREALPVAELAAREEPDELATVSNDGVHALAAALRGRPDGGRRRILGFLSIARSGAEFETGERDLFTYLAAQASVSLDNARLHETVQAQARTDALTGLSNRRHFEVALEAEIGRSHRFGSDVGLVMMDLDGFKPINDLHGHQEGDRVLCAVAAVLKGITRDVDELARYGGDEVAIILPETDTSGAELLAERVRAAVEALEVERSGDGPPLKLTASFGAASLPETAHDRDSLVAAADAALYRAKRAGGNRVVRADGAPVPR